MRLLNLMGSRLEVDSTYGEGSDFYFYLEQKQLDDEVIGEDCMGDEEFCRELLKVFLDSPFAKELGRCYEESDFENYRIKIHAMKSNLGNIGAMTVSDMAKQLELSLENDNNVSYVKENHGKFMAAYERKGHNPSE